MADDSLLPSGRWYAKKLDLLFSTGLYRFDGAGPSLKASHLL
jgi:hypothetical protein